MGVITAGIIVISGGAFYLAVHGTDLPDYRMFHGEPTDLTSLKGIVEEAVSLTGRGVIQCGIVVLMAIPVARVAFSIFAFARQKDKLYVAVTVVVFTILVLSLLGIFQG